MCRYVRLNALNVLHVPRPCLITPHFDGIKCCLTFVLLCCCCRSEKNCSLNCFCLVRSTSARYSVLWWRPLVGRFCFSWNLHPNQSLSTWTCWIFLRKQNFTLSFLCKQFFKSLYVIPFYCFKLNIESEKNTKIVLIRIKLKFICKNCQPFCTTTNVLHW